MKNALKAFVAGIVLTCLVAAPGYSATIRWDDGAADDNWSSGANWTNIVGGTDNTSPVNGDSVELTATQHSFLDYSWTIESGQSLTSLTSGSADDMGISNGGSLTLASGGTMDIGFFRPRGGGTRDFIIEAGPGTSLATDIYGSGFQMDITYIADASGVTTWFNSSTSANEFQIPADTLTVDLSNYNIANGNTLVLVDYANAGVLSGTFASITLTSGWTADIDYAYDQNGGDLAIALTNLMAPPVPEPSTVALFGLGAAVLCLCGRRRRQR